jgi:hypothetical protein
MHCVRSGEITGVGRLAELNPAPGAGRFAVVVFRSAMSTVNDIYGYEDEPLDLAHSVKDATIAVADAAVISRFAVRMGGKLADSLAAGTVHHGAILDHSIDRKYALRRDCHLLLLKCLVRRAA